LKSYHFGLEIIYIYISIMFPVLDNNSHAWCLSHSSSVFLWLNLPSLMLIIGLRHKIAILGASAHFLFKHRVGFLVSFHACWQKTTCLLVSLCLSWFIFPNLMAPSSASALESSDLFPFNEELSSVGCAM
jgi:hypothetical protein